MSSQSEREEKSDHKEEVVEPKGYYPRPPEAENVQGYRKPDDVTGINPDKRKPIHPDSPFLSPA